MMSEKIIIYLRCRYQIFMATIGIFKKVIEKRRFYLPVFYQQATYLQQAASALCEMTEAVDSAQWRRLEKEIKACEVQGDALLTELHEQLTERLVLEIRKIDVQSIALNMDELLDHINDSAKSFHLYNPGRIDPHLSDLAQYLYAQTDAIKKMLSFFGDLKKNYSQIVLQCERITELEHAADDAYEEYIGFIFKNETNAIEVIKFKNIAELLESATDAAKRVSDGVRKIIYKYID